MNGSEKDILSRHFELNLLIESSYKNRDTYPDAIDICIQHCLEDITLMPSLIIAWTKENQGLGKKSILLPLIPSFERLAIIYEHQEKYDAAIQICQQAIQFGLDDPERCHSPRDFVKRMTKLRKKIDSQRPYAAPLQSAEIPTSNNIPEKSENLITPVQSLRPSEERGIHVNWIAGVRLSSASNRTLYEGASATQLTIESFALEHYQVLGYTGFHSENDYWWIIMSLLFWDVIFAKIPGVYSPHFGDFPSPLQDMPQDLFTPNFYPRRQELISRRVAELTEARFFGLRKPNIETVLRAAFREYYNKPCRSINWDLFTVDNLVLAVTALTPKQLMKIMQRLLENFNEHRRGLPDLFLVKDDEVLFVEVKAEKEKIADHQLSWLLYLQQNVGVKSEICRVTGK